jgi:hypothetical protein
VKAGAINTFGSKLPVRNLSVAAEVLAEPFDHSPHRAFFVRDDAGRYSAVSRFERSSVWSM